MCNAPRYGAVEERTGLGGGFNERENVEYKEHVSDEDELYDEVLCAHRYCLYVMYIY